jgi:hypothetical protein
VTEDPQQAPRDERRSARATLRKLALPIAFLAVGLPVGIGAVMAMGHDPPPPEQSPFTPVSQAPGARPQQRAQPRWEQVAAFTGTGSARRAFVIAPRAIQWRADWRCESGAFRVTVGRPSGAARVLTSSGCPDVGVETSTGTGPGNLQVSATGDWRIVVRQQVDTALDEPPLPGMTRAALLGRGRFHGIQKHGEGTVSLYRLPGGRLALRFERFYTSASPGLRVWLSRAPNVRSTLEARQAKYADAGAIRSTLGSYDQMLPASVRADQVHSVVIWCPTVLIAFAAAPLARPS